MSRRDIFESACFGSINKSVPNVTMVDFQATKSSSCIWSNDWVLEEYRWRWLRECMHWCLQLMSPWCDLSSAWRVMTALAFLTIELFAVQTTRAIQRLLAIAGKTQAIHTTRDHGHRTQIPPFAPGLEVNPRWGVVAMVWLRRRMIGNCRTWFLLPGCWVVVGRRSN